MYILMDKANVKGLDPRPSFFNFCKLYVHPHKLFGSYFAFGQVRMCMCGSYMINYFVKLTWKSRATEIIIVIIIHNICVNNNTL